MLVPHVAHAVAAYVGTSVPLDSWYTRTNGLVEPALPPARAIDTMVEQIRAGRVLVLDDELDVAETMCRMAESAAFDTNHTHDANVFLQHAVDWAPTHVVVDLQLSDLDGVEVLHALAEMRCDAAVIIVSGLGERILDSSARVATESGLWLAGVLSKPFTRPQFLDLLAHEVRSTPTHSGTSARTDVRAVTHEQLAEALRARRFIAHFQPKVSCGDGALVGFECLARWPQPSGGMIPPNHFIRVAEQAGLIQELTRQVYTYVFAHLPSRPESTALKFALNLSPVNLDDESFPRWLVDLCELYGVAPYQVILELTETASMENPLSLLEKLTQFRIRGFQLSIDDFGVGYSSLVQLARLPFSELKIDQTFVKNLSDSAESRKIVTAVLGLGSSLGLTVVAEGVEDARALEFLRNEGCDEAQGYFIARPMDSHAAAAWNGEPWPGAI